MADVHMTLVRAWPADTHTTRPIAADDTQHARLTAHMPHARHSTRTADRHVHTTRAHAAHTAWPTYNTTHAQLRDACTRHTAWPRHGTQPTDMCTQDTCAADRHHAHNTRHSTRAQPTDSAHNTSVHDTCAHTTHGQSADTAHMPHTHS